MGMAEARRLVHILTPAAEKRVAPYSEPINRQPYLVDSGCQNAGPVDQTGKPWQSKLSFRRDETQWDRQTSE